MSESFPPEHYVPVVSFQVAGDPVGAGSKDAIPLGRWVHAGGQRVFKPITRPGGVPIVNVVDTTDKTGGPEWRQAIKDACERALDEAHELIDSPIAVRVTFFGSSPKNRYGTGKNADVLKDSADRLPHAAALSDGTKLARALEDSLNALCWRDDRRVCDLWWSRRFGVNPGARVDIYAAPATFAEIPGAVAELNHPDQAALAV